MTNFDNTRQRLFHEEASAVINGLLTVINGEPWRLAENHGTYRAATYNFGAVTLMFFNSYLHH